MGATRTFRGGEGTMTETYELPLADTSAKLEGGNLYREFMNELES